MSDTAAIDAGLVALLQADATLRELAPGGVWWDLAPPNTVATHVIVGQQAHGETFGIDGADMFEEPVYLVKAVGRVPAAVRSGGPARSAAARIHTLLHHQRFSATGYTVQTVRRIERIHYSEVDERAADTRWQHSGGLYEIFASPTGS